MCPSTYVHLYTMLTHIHTCEYPYIHAKPNVRTQRYTNIYTQACSARTPNTLAHTHGRVHACPHVDTCICTCSHICTHVPHALPHAYTQTRKAVRAHARHAHAWPRALAPALRPDGPRRPPCCIVLPGSLAPRQAPSLSGFSLLVTSSDSPLGWKPLSTRR